MYSKLAGTGIDSNLSPTRVKTSNLWAIQYDAGKRAAVKTHKQRKRDFLTSLTWTKPYSYILACHRNTSVPKDNSGWCVRQTRFTASST